MFRCVRRARGRVEDVARGGRGVNAATRERIRAAGRRANERRDDHTCRPSQTTFRRTW
jgi:hypothetical protein